VTDLSLLCDSTPLCVFCCTRNLLIFGLHAFPTVEPELTFLEKFGLLQPRSRTSLPFRGPLDCCKMPPSFFPKISTPRTIVRFPSFFVTYSHDGDFNQIVCNQLPPTLPWRIACGLPSTLTMSRPRPEASDYQSRTSSQPLIFRPCTISHPPVLVPPPIRTSPIHRSFLLVPASWT